MSAKTITKNSKNSNTCSNQRKPNYWEEDRNFSFRFPDLTVLVRRYSNHSLCINFYIDTDEVYQKIRSLQIESIPTTPQIIRHSDICHDSDTITLCCPPRVLSGNNSKFRVQVNTGKLLRDKSLYDLLTIFTASDHRRLKLKNNKDYVGSLVLTETVELNVRLSRNPGEIVYACCTLYEGATLYAHLDSPHLAVPTKRNNKSKTNEPQRNIQNMWEHPTADYLVLSPEEEYLLRQWCPEHYSIDATLPPFSLLDCEFEQLNKTASLYADT